MRWKKRPKGEVVFKEEVAKEYDRWFETTKGRYAALLENELILDLAKIKTGSSVLDVGCGTAIHLLLFGSLGTWGSGIDISREMLDIAKKKLTNTSEKKIFLLQGDGEILPYKDSSFDLVTLITSLELFNDPISALSEAIRVSRGHLLIAVLNRLSLSAFHRRLRGIFRRTIFEHVNFYSLWGLKKLVKTALSAGGKVRIQWRTTLFSFPLVARSLVGVLQKLDCWLTRLRWPFGAFLVMRVDLEEDR